MKTRGLSPHSRPKRFGRLDGRTHEARLFNAFRAELVAHLGGEARMSVAQAALVEQICWIRLRLALMDGKLAAGDFGQHDSDRYLAWANTLGRLLSRLGLEPVADAVKPDPQAFFAAVRARDRGAAA